MSTRTALQSLYLCMPASTHKSVWVKAGKMSCRYHTKYLGFVLFCLLLFFDRAHAWHQSTAALLTLLRSYLLSLRCFYSNCSNIKRVVQSFHRLRSQQGGWFCLCCVFAPVHLFHTANCERKRLAALQEEKTHWYTECCWLNTLDLT